MNTKFVVGSAFKTYINRVWQNSGEGYSLTVFYQLWSLRIWTKSFVSCGGLWVFVRDCFGKTLFCSNITMLPCRLCKSSSIKTRFNYFCVEDLDVTYIPSITLRMN